MRKVYCDICEGEIKKKPAYQIYELDDYMDEDSDLEIKVGLLCQKCFNKIKKEER